MRKIRKYCLRSPLVLFLGLCIGNLIGDVTLFLEWEMFLELPIVDRKDDTIMFYIFSAVSFLGWLFITYSMETMYFTDARRLVKQVRRIKRKGKYKALIEDLKNGEKIFAGNLIVGNSCLIGRRYGTIVCYDDNGTILRAHISTVDVRTGGTNKVEYMLMYQNGKHDYNVCELPETKFRNKQWDNLYEMINQRQGSLNATTEFLDYMIRVSSSPPPPPDDGD